jgi:branched-chain amino acid transport system substrate-binding protein
LYEDHAIALFGYRSTLTVEAVLPLLVAEKIALVAPFSGAQTLHHPFNPYLFHLRASYQDETAKMVEVIKTLQIKNVALLYQNDPFGKDGLEGFERNLKAAHLSPLTTIKYERQNLDMDQAAKEMMALSPQAVLMACTPNACINFIKKMRKNGAQTQYMMLSNVNSSEFFKELGSSGRGVGVMQVMPYPRDLEAAIVREFQHTLKEMKNPPPLSYSALEGFAAAKLLVEALRRAGPNPTRAKLIAALETMHATDLGGIVVNYSHTNHDGSPFVELVVVGKDGAFYR